MKKQMIKMVSIIAAIFILITPIKAQQAAVSITMPYVYMCVGNNAILDAGGGTCGASYLWAASGETTQTITVSNGGLFVVTITYPDGGVCEKTFIVVYYPSSLGEINVSGTLCSGNNINLTASSGCNYVWSSPDYSISNPNVSSIEVTPQSAGVYNFNVTGTNYYGCQETKTTSITINPSPNVTITANRPTFICAGTDITLTGNGASSYVWSNGASTNNITVAPTSNTTYTVTGTNANGCSNTASLTVTTSTVCVRIADNRCNNTIDNLFDDGGKMQAQYAIPNAMNYIFTFTDINTGTVLTLQSGNEDHYVSLWESGSLTYDTQYLVTVQAQLSDGTYTPVSPACTYTIVKPATSIQSAPTNYCGRSVSNLQGEKMFAFAVGNASNYQFTFTGISGDGVGAVSTATSYTGSNIPLTTLNPPLSYNTSYSVTVQVTAPGPNGLPITGPVSAETCVYNVGAPQTTVKPAFCSARQLGWTFSVNTVLYATSYVYTFSPVGGGTATVITSTSPTITLSSSVSTNSTSATYLSSGPQLSNNTVYNVSITVTAQTITGPASTAPCQLTIGTPTNRIANPGTGYTNESTNEAGLTIFPNPATEKINITLGNVTDKKYTIEMYDMFGKLIYKNEVLNAKESELNTEIDLKNLNLPSGIYLIYVNSETQKISKRVVIDK